ncbi:hypothetical protein DFH07DRAFT_1057299 [Mycena maculata]|uniref:SH3 domain-containing protein n=1 Tax=Mycena maculata TaxID=230809 RepID=A0AAD7NS55_9AGAR|nr:hypothetical protein DFH07DRAFT_1057299 [Mycena maculata]
MHHHPARMVRERRQAPSSVVSPSATAIVDHAAPTTTTTSAVDLTPPTSTSVLAAVVAILAVVILIGFGICVYRRKRNAKKSAADSHIVDFSSEKMRRFDVDSKLDLHASAYILEKPSPAFMPGASAADMNPNWVPQIPNRGAGLASQSSSSSKKSKSSKKSLRSSRGWDKTFSKIAPSERSPPPSYMPSVSSPSGVPLPPSPPHLSTLPPTPPTPPANKKLNPFSREIPAAKPEPTDFPPQMPLPSPARSASFATHQAASLAEMDEEAMPPPRLMTVTTPFAPGPESPEDELPISHGETVRILEEYQDGWALVQRVGRIDAPKGVVPRSCLTDRERIIPIYTPGRRL